MKHWIDADLFLGSARKLAQEGADESARADETRQHHHHQTRQLRGDHVERHEASDRLSDAP